MKILCVPGEFSHDFWDICKFIAEKSEDKNPKFSNCTLLHYAALNGQYELCKFIIQNVQVRVEMNYLR